MDAALARRHHRGQAPVLVLRALGLGDALAGVPALRGLRRLHPNRPLLLAAPDPIGRWLTGLALVDGYVPTSGLDDRPPGLGLGPHDAVNLHGRGPQSHQLLLAARPRSLLAFAPPGGEAAGWAAPGTLPRWRADEHEVLRWCRLVACEGGPCGPEYLRLEPETWAAPEDAGTARPYVVLHPGAASAARRWPVERWAEVARTVKDWAEVRLTGSADERPLCEVIATVAALDAGTVVAGTLDLPHLLALVGRARLLVCGDTGVAHVATATGTPSVVLFGPVSPSRWGPAVDRDRHVCLWHGDGTGDPHGYAPDPALLRITSAEVLVAARALLDQERGSPRPHAVADIPGPR